MGVEMKYIAELREDMMIGEIYFCKKKQELLTKAGKPYFNLQLQDKTGVLDAKVWNTSSSGIEEFSALDYIYVAGRVISYQGAYQLNVERIRKCQEGEYVISDYLPTSKRNIIEMYEELLDYINKMKTGPLKQLVEHFFVEDKEFIQAFQTHSAAKTVHHSFIGGLLEHTLGVVKLCEHFTQNYPILNRDLLIAAALFHDVGKLDELSKFPENDYTDDGQLLGHIFIGAERVGKAIEQIKDFPVKLASELRHCILAHHGELEYGSPKKPALAEAMALNFADNADAKLQAMVELFDGAPENSEWLGFNRVFDSNIKKSSR